MDRRAVRRAGLQRVTRLTGWLAAGALVASGAFVALLARPTATSATRSVPPSSGPTTFGHEGDGVPPATVGADQGSAGPDLAPPAQIPQSTVAPAQVTSGQS